MASATTQSSTVSESTFFIFFGLGDRLDRSDLEARISSLGCHLSPTILDKLMLVLLATISDTPIEYSLTLVLVKMVVWSKEGGGPRRRLRTRKSVLKRKLIRRWIWKSIPQWRSSYYLWGRLDAAQGVRNHLRVGHLYLIEELFQAVVLSNQVIGG